MRSAGIPRFLMTFGIALAACGPADAQTRFTVDPKTEIAIPLGVTKVDYDFDGRKGIVLKSHNDFNSAHNNYTYFFALFDWRTLLFEKENMVLPEKLGFPGIHTDHFESSQGADYTLRSIRLLSDRKARKTYVVVADRPLNDSFVDSMPVTLELFTLTGTPPDKVMPGMPAEYFRLTAWFTTEKCYPDADFAVHEELGLKLPEGSEVDPKQASLSQPCAK